jgi:hypothetical protein
MTFNMSQEARDFLTYTPSIGNPAVSGFEGNKNRFLLVGNFDGDPKGTAGILVMNLEKYMLNPDHSPIINLHDPIIDKPGAMGILKLSYNQNTGVYDLVLLAKAINGDHLGEWWLNLADNNFGPAGYFDGSNRAEILVTSPWGIGILKLNSSNILEPIVMRGNENIGDWLLNTAANQFGPVGNFGGDIPRKDEVVITNPSGISILQIDSTNNPSSDVYQRKPYPSRGLVP